MKQLNWLADWFFKFVGVVAGLVFLFAIFLDFANVVGRYVFHHPIFWAEEIAVYAIIWCVMAGAALVVWRSAHLRVEILEMFLPSRTKMWLRGVILLVVGLVALTMVYYGTQFVTFIASLDQRSAVSGIPMSLAFAAIPVGFALVALAAFVRVARHLFDPSGAADDLGAEGDPNGEEASL